MTDPQTALGTFAAGDGIGFPGLLVGGRVHRIADILEGSAQALPPAPSMLDVIERWDGAWPRLRAFGEAATAGGVDLAALSALAPVRPRQIICAGANYRRHVIELMADHEGAGGRDLDPEQRRREGERLMDHRAAHGQPFVFAKPVSALLDPFDALTLPSDSEQVDWELELAVVIGRPTRRVRRQDALSHIAGFTIANDITARDRLARRDFPTLGFDWLAGKGAPGFLPLGPYIVPTDLVADPQALTITLSLNGERMQHESTADMIFPVARLVEYVSTYIALSPGDVICTGSPAGNGTHYDRYLRSGDVMEGQITGLGLQRIRCAAEDLAFDAPTHQTFTPLPALES